MLDQVNDLKSEALTNLGYPAGNVNDQWFAWFKGEGMVGNTLNDVQREFLLSQGVPNYEHLNDMWFEWLGSLGYTGDLRDRWWQYWKDGGGGGTEPVDFLVDEFDELVVDENGEEILV